MLSSQRAFTEQLIVTQVARHRKNMVVTSVSSEMKKETRTFFDFN